jgi:hypothetical protein
MFYGLLITTPRCIVKTQGILRSFNLIEVFCIFVNDNSWLAVAVEVRVAGCQSSS